MEIEEIGIVQARFACAFHQRQRLLMLAEALAYVGQRQQGWARAAARDFRMLQTLKRGGRLAYFGKRLGHAADQMHVRGQRGQRGYQLFGRSADSALGQHHPGQQQPHGDRIGMPAQQILQLRSGLIPTPRGDMPLRLLPFGAVEGVHRRAPAAGARAFVRLRGIMPAMEH